VLLLALLVAAWPSKVARWLVALRAWWRAVRHDGAVALVGKLAHQHSRIRRWVPWLAVRVRRRWRAMSAAIVAAARSWRAARAARSAWPRAESDDFTISQEDLDASGDDGMPEPASASPAPGVLPRWTARLSVRARAWRGLLIVGTVALALFVVVGGPATLLADVQQWAASFPAPRVAAAAPPRLNASFWVARRIPYQALDARGIILAPSATDSALAYACWVDGRSGQAATPPVNLYVTADGARSWQALQAPPDQARACQPIADTADSARLLLVLTPSSAGDCATPGVYASADRGANWHTVALPGALAGACDPTFALARGIIYAWSPAAQAQGSGGPAAQLLISGDYGLSWRPAFATVPANATVALVAARANGALLVLVSVPGAHPASAPAATLWCRATADAAWQALAALPAGTSTAYAANGQPSGRGCSWGAIYAAGYATGDDPSITRLAVSSGRGWQTLPPLPVAATASESPVTPDGRVLSVGPDDTLLVAIPYSGPGIGVTAGAATPAHTFWGWDPHSGRWLEDVHIAPANSSIDGFVWDYTQNGAPRLFCWVYTLNAGVPAFTGLYRASFAAPSAPSQDAGDQRAPGL
jgi:hypothetical protein